MAASRRSFTNPDTSPVILNVAGNAFVIEFAPEESDPANSTTIHVGDGNDGGGLPLVHRMKVRLQNRFERLTINPNSGRTAGTVYIVVFDTAELDVSMPG